ncbi:MAG: hypothetical protein KKB31_00575 [Nanoarchaeota archaeon]|nr:hypothetical protein [Nanoarchaeota archaeon]
MENKLIGKWAFLGGLIIAVIAGFMTEYVTTIAFVLFVLGLIVGFLNVSEKESTKFLIAAIALLTGGIASLTALSMLGVSADYIITVLANFVAFISAAALVVAIKAIFETGR